MLTLKLVIVILIFNWIMPHMIDILLSLLPLPNEKNFAYVGSNKVSMLVDHGKNALGDGYIVEFIHDSTENYYEGGTYACRNCNNIKFPLYVLKTPMHRKWVRLKCASHIYVP